MKFKIFVAILLIAAFGFSNDLRWDNGLKYLKEGKYEDAIKRFQSLAEEYPEVYQYHLMWGQCLVAMKNMDEALVRFKKAYELKPDSPDAAFSYAQVLQAQGDYETFSRVLESMDTSKISQSKLDKMYYMRGISRFNQKNFEGAAEDLSRVKNEQYANQSSYYLAYSLYSLNKLDKALKALDHVNEGKKLDGLKLKHKILRAKLQEVKDEVSKNTVMQKSLAVSEELLKLDPSAESYYAAGQTALFAGNYEKARKYLDKAAKEMGGYAAYYLSIAHLKDKNLQAAEMAIIRAEPGLKENNDKKALCNLYCNWGVIFHNREQFEKAISYYNKGLELGENATCSEQLKLAKQGKAAIEKQKKIKELIGELDDYK